MDTVIRRRLVPAPGCHVCSEIGVCNFHRRQQGRRQLSPFESGLRALARSVWQFCRVHLGVSS